MKQIVAIVGRPNVGKSTLMNRILGRREAIVEEQPGVTRDRKEVEASWQGREFTLVDTGGWITAGDSLDQEVSRQSERAMSEADVVLFVVDSTVGVTEDDARVAALLRGTDAPVIVVANKVDDRVHEASIWELMSLGLGAPAPVFTMQPKAVAVSDSFRASESPASISPESALRRSGRFMVRIATPSSTRACRCSVPVSIVRLSAMTLPPWGRPV